MKKIILALSLFLSLSTIGYSQDTTLNDTIVDVLVPVELSYYRVQYEHGSEYIDFTWETYTEINNDYFKIMYSDHDYNYRELYRIQGHGTTFEKQVYNCSVLVPQTGYLLLKLVQVDYDGTETDEAIISIEVEEIVVDHYIFFSLDGKLLGRVESLSELSIPGEPYYTIPITKSGQPLNIRRIFLRK